MLGLSINLIKNNDGLGLLFEPPFNPAEDPFSPELTFEEASALELKAYEVDALRKHYFREVRNLASLLGTSLDNIDYIELDDFLGIDNNKAMKLVLLRLKNSSFDTDELPPEEIAAK